MDIFDKAKDLGRSIAASEQMLRLKNAEAAMESDDKSKQLMDEYKKLQIATVRASKDHKDKEIIDAIKDELLKKQQEINEYSVTKEYLVSKSEFDNFMKTINDVMIYSITGEEPCSSSKCASCGAGCNK